MPLDRMALFFAMASGLVLTACNRNEASTAAPSSSKEESSREETTPSVPPGFVADYRALKNSEKDPVRLEAGVRDLLARYRLSPPGQESGQSIPGPVTPSIADGESFSSGLGKAAATSWYTVKSANFALDFVHIVTKSIPANARLTVTNDHDPATSTLDPFAVAFYKPAGAPDPNLTKVTLVGINDDGGGNFNSWFTWVNNTGATKAITVIGSAYLASTSGVGTLTITCTTSAGASCGSYTKTTGMSGVSVRSNQAVNAPGCSGPTGSTISLAVAAGGDHGPGVFAANAGTMRGGWIYVHPGTLALDDVLTPTAPSFVMGFSSGIGGFSCGVFGGPPKTCYESPNSYSFIQKDSYNCP